MSEKILKKECEFVFENEQFDYSNVAGNIFSDEKIRMSKSKKILIAIISFLLIIAVSASFIFFKYFYVTKPFETVENLQNLAMPLQEDASGEIKKVIDGYEVTFTIKANYTLCGMVVEKYYYMPTKIVNKVSRFDFGMVFGPLLSEDVKGLMTFRNNGSRFLKYGYDTRLSKKMGGREAVVDSISNNHIIHSDERVLKLARNVKEGDYIKIEGYLVDMDYVGKNQKGNWPTSLSRTDHGDGACEVFYVTNITWLKEAK